MNIRIDPNGQVGSWLFVYRCCVSFNLLFPNFLDSKMWKSSKAHATNTLGYRLHDMGRKIGVQLLKR